jgi:choline kinase
MVPVVGRPMLDHILDALAAGGFERCDVVFICGYQAAAVKRAYPELTYVHNDGWETNNILVSLLCAREHMRSGFVSSYADIVYRPEIVAELARSPHEITLGCDTDWRRRYRDRSQHPESDGEKMRLSEGDGRVLELSRRIAPEEASGEFIGVMRMTAHGAAELLAAYDAARAEFAEDPEFREGRSFEKAYLIDLLQHMIERGVRMHALEVHGGYMEIDTTEDAACAEKWWSTS